MCIDVSLHPHPPTNRNALLNNAYPPEHLVVVEEPAAMVWSRWRWPRFPSTTIVLLLLSSWRTNIRVRQRRAHVTGIARAFAVHRFFVAGCDCTQLYLLLLFEGEEDKRDSERERVRNIRKRKRETRLIRIWNEVLHGGVEFPRTCPACILHNSVGY